MVFFKISYLLKYFIGYIEILPSFSTALILISHQKFFQSLDFFRIYAIFWKKRFLDITWEKIVLQSPTKKQINCLGLLNNYMLFSSFKLYWITKKSKKTKNFFENFWFFFFIKTSFFLLIKNSFNHSRIPFNTLFVYFLLNTSKLFRLWGTSFFESCMQIELGRWYSSIPYSDVTICNLNSMSKVKRR